MPSLLQAFRVLSLISIHCQSPSFESQLVGVVCAINETMEDACQEMDSHLEGEGEEVEQDMIDQDTDAEQASTSYMSHQIVSMLHRTLMLSERMFSYALFFRMISRLGRIFRFPISVQPAARPPGRKCSVVIPHKVRVLGSAAFAWRKSSYRLIVVRMSRESGSLQRSGRACGQCIFERMLVCSDGVAVAAQYVDQAFHGADVYDDIWQDEAQDGMSEDEMEHLMVHIVP